MYCPKCQSIELKPITYRGVTIDKCPRCEGVWLDKGEETFVVEILAYDNDAACSRCTFFDSSKGKCTRLKIYVRRDFTCANYVPR